MINDYFTQLEALAKQGKQIKSKVEFSGVPKGTIGIVTGMYESNFSRFGISITWSLPNRIYPLVDGFSKRDYELVEEIP